MGDFERKFSDAQQQAQPNVVKLENAASRRRLKTTGETASPIDGARLLDEVHRFFARFVAYPSEAAHIAHTLWTAHTHLMDVWDSTPRLACLSPEHESGKTRVLEVTELLVPNPVEAVNVTPAYLIRKMGSPEGPPTVLYDEIDTVFGPKAKDNEEIRGLLNAGHRRGAVAGRCVMRGKVIETEEFPAYGAVAIAGIGNLPPTILSRCVILKMRRRAPDEHVEQFRRRMHGPEGEALRERTPSCRGRCRRRRLAQSCPCCGCYACYASAGDAPNFGSTASCGSAAGLRRGRGPLDEIPAGGAAQAARVPLGRDQGETFGRPWFSSAAAPIRGEAKARAHRRHHAARLRPCRPP
jgi:hypothetical protein